MSGAKQVGATGQALSLQQEKCEASQNGSVDGRAGRAGQGWEEGSSRAGDGGLWVPLCPKTAADSVSPEGPGQAPHQRLKMRPASIMRNPNRVRIPCV